MRIAEEGGRHKQLEGTVARFLNCIVREGGPDAARSTVQNGKLRFGLQIGVALSCRQYSRGNLQPSCDAGGLDAVWRGFLSQTYLMLRFEG